MAEKANKHRELTGVRAREILEHLFTNYGEILAQDIVANRVKLGEEWDPNTLFQTLDKRCKKFKNLQQMEGEVLKKWTSPMYYTR